jgi:hypothetical protein
VPGCCKPGGYERLFSAKQARLDARRYRKRGLAGTSRDLAELAGDVSGATVLEVGGGVGVAAGDVARAGVAAHLQQGAAAAIYFGERLYQFPLGLIGIAAATAVFPLLSSHAARNGFFLGGESAAEDSLGMSVRS